MLLLVGANHRSAPIAIRERMAVSEAALPAALTRLRAIDGVGEGWILSTCNRTELLVRADVAASRLRDPLRRLLLGGEVDAHDAETHLYELTAESAVQHVFRVTCGLDSMILGEPQIAGQMKRAYSVARDAGATGPVLDRLLQHAFATSKRVRTETRIGENPVSMASAAVGLARKVFGDLAGQSALIVGTGEIGTLLGRHLQGQGLDRLHIVSRTSYTRAVTVADELGAEAIPWDRLHAFLARVDILVSCTGAPHVVLTADDVRSVQRQRGGRSLFAIDLAVPRDLDPAIHRIDQVYLYDVDALQDVVDGHLDERRAAARDAQRIVDDEVVAFSRWRQTQRVAPLIVRMHERVATTAETELERYLARRGPVDASDERALREMLHRVTRKLLHRPVRHLRNAAELGRLDEVSPVVEEWLGGDDGAPARGERTQERSGVSRPARRRDGGER